MTTNRKRAETVDKAVRQYLEAHKGGEVSEDTVADLICDIGHWMEQLLEGEHDFPGLLRIYAHGIGMFSAERVEPDPYANCPVDIWVYDEDFETENRVGYVMLPEGYHPDKRLTPWVTVLYEAVREAEEPLGGNYTPTNLFFHTRDELRRWVEGPEAPDNLRLSTKECQAWTAFEAADGSYRLLDRRDTVLVRGSEADRTQRAEAIWEAMRPHDRDIIKEFIQNGRDQEFA